MRVALTSAFLDSACSQSFSAPKFYLGGEDGERTGVVTADTLSDSQVTIKLAEGGMWVKVRLQVGCVASKGFQVVQVNCSLQKNGQRQRILEEVGTLNVVLLQSHRGWTLETPAVHDLVLRR